MVFLAATQEFSHLSHFLLIFNRSQELRCINEKEIPIIVINFVSGRRIYNLWTLRPVKVLHASSDGYGDVELVVTHMPWTDMEKFPGSF
jgi:hypothetical protein